MSVVIDAEADAKIELLRQQFVRRMKQDAGLIQPLLDVMGSLISHEAEIGSLRRVCHSLCGAAGVFGYPVVAEAASRVSAAFATGERDGVRLGRLAGALLGEIRKATNGA